ncbi:MAG: NADPH-dependent F420 reductase [Candidatus Hadarchaeota archaeon]|nr:NADPH-dependent F420 reductase [Candidatus Hadarchaeota archaeon]
MIGGTGAAGRGLVARWVSAGEEVVIGSRRREKAERIASEISKQVEQEVRGTTNLEAAREAEVVVLSIPFKAVEKIIEQIEPALKKDKILVSVIAPLIRKHEQITFKIPRAGSAAEEVAQRVPKNVPVISAFQTVSAKHLQNVRKPLSCDILVCGDDDRARGIVIKLMEKIPGARPVDFGPLRNSRLVEPVAALLAELTRRYKVPGVGVRFEGF